MNKKLAVALVLILVVSLVAAPAVMAEETDQKEEETYTLDELVVIASKHPEKLSETSVSVEKIDEEDIEKKNASNVVDVLRNLGSVYVKDQGGAADTKMVQIRGSHQRHVLILVDGQPINRLQSGAANLGQISVEQIKEIEVLKGPGSAIYGGNALGGVISITTKDGSEESITNVDMGFGSFKTRELDVSHRGSAGNLKYNVTALKKKTDGGRWKDINGHGGAVDHDNIFTKFDYQLDKYSNLTLSLRYNDFEKKLLDSENMDTYPNYQREMDDESTSINLQWIKKQEKKDTKVAFYNNQREIIDDDPKGNSYTKTEPEKTGINIDQIIYYQTHTLTYGLEFEEDKIEGTQYSHEEDLNKAFFFKIIGRLLKI